MATLEIKSTDWEAFCGKFLELHRGALMTVKQIERSGREVEVVRDMPLTGMKFEQRNGCTDRIMLNFEQEGRREVWHEVIDPIHVKVREEREGEKGIQIDAENGSTMLLFSSGRMAELMEGLETV